MINIKLNNRGWGLQAMMVCILILMIALVIVAVIVEKNFKNLINPINNESYASLEEKVVDAAKIFHKNNYQNLDDDEVISIKALKRNDLLDDIKDIKDNKSCSGYVVIRKDDKLNYKAYIKCSNYTTKGYSSNLDTK